MAGKAIIAGARAGVCLGEFVARGGTAALGWQANQHGSE